MAPKVKGAGTLPGEQSHRGQGHHLPRKFALVLGLTALFTLVEVVGGMLANSLTLLADAGHMGTDVAALGLALIGARIARRRDGSAQRFGNLRWEILAALLNGLALFVIGAGITLAAIDRFFNPRVVNASLFGGVAIAGIAVNLLSLSVLHGHREHNLNARGVYLHVLGDILGAVGALVAAIIIHYTGWVRVDPIVSVLVSVIILRSAWRLVRESSVILLDRAPEAVPAADVERQLLQVGGVARAHDIHVWSVTSGLVAMSAHVVVPQLDAHPGVRHELEDAMSRLGIRHVTIQLETEGECEAEQCGEEAGAGAAGGHGHEH
jgi:cobalt-zinc-cadmium efflux system protein